MSKYAKEAEDFITKNPHVWDMFVQYTFEVINTGKYRHFSAKAIWERMRWDSLINVVYTDYKLNNNYHAYFSSKFQKAFPEHKNFFRTRVQK
jgi:hypothetical protein